MRTQTSKERGLPEKILFLRETAPRRSYRKIKAILEQEGYGNVSLGTIAYHLGEGQKEKTLETSKKRQEGICSKVHGFIYDERKPYQKSVYKIGPVRKKARGFVNGPRRGNYKINKAALEHPHQKVWTYIGKVFPGIKS